MTILSVILIIPIFFKVLLSSDIESALTASNIAKKQDDVDIAVIAGPSGEVRRLLQIILKNQLIHKLNFFQYLSGESSDDDI